MRLADVGMIAAETSRSRAYVQTLERHGFLPAFVLVLGGGTGGRLPGQPDAASGPRSIAPDDECWSETGFDVAEPVSATLKRAGIPFQVLPVTDIHDAGVIAAVAARAECTFIYSGYGGVLLRSSILRTGKQFLHVHGGYLPDYKGSTTNYYSLLADGTMGASALFLSEQIDSGTVLMRRRFPAPPDRTRLDHVYDSAARAKVLIATLQQYALTREWPLDSQAQAPGETYFIIHPVLKHIAILAADAPC